jgi:hypothetical protein
VDTSNNIERYKLDFYAHLNRGAVLNRQIEMLNPSQ